MPASPPPFIVFFLFFYPDNEEEHSRYCCQSVSGAAARNDTTSLSRILTDGFTLVHMTGYNQPKEEWLTHIQTGRMQYFGSVEHDIHVEVRSDNKVFVIGKSQVDANIWGARGTWPLKLKLHFIRQEEELKISFIEASTY